MVEKLKTVVLVMLQEAAQYLSKSEANRESVNKIIKEGK